MHLKYILSGQNLHLSQILYFIYLNDERGIDLVWIMKVVIQSFQGYLQYQFQILSQVNSLNSQKITKTHKTLMSLQQRISSMIKRKIQQESQTDFISDSPQQQPIKTCTDKLFRLIVKLQESKAKSKKQYPVQIREKIFIGNYVFASDDEFLKKSNIGLVISCLSTSPVKSFQHVHYEKISIKDQEGENLLQYGDRVHEIIESHLQNNNTNVYIHCFHGKSRSTAVLIMYLMRREKKTLDTLLTEIKKLFPLAQPNKWFMQQLKSYQNTIQNTFTITEGTEKAQQDDLLGFELQPVQTNSSKKIPLQKIQLDILQNTTTTVSSPDQRQHLLIPQHQKNNSPNKTTQYHLIEIDQDDQNTDLI